MKNNEDYLKEKTITIPVRYENKRKKIYYPEGTGYEIEYTTLDINIDNMGYDVIFRFKNKTCSPFLIYFWIPPKGSRSDSKSISV